MAASITETAAAEAATAAEECKDEDAISSTLHSCANDPNFAIICAFLQKFSKDLGLELPNFKHLQLWLTNNDEVPELKALHIKLLRKTRKTVHEKSWESALSKFCFGYSAQDAWEIERFGYKNSSLKVKLRVFRELLESQFERNAKFRAHILTLNADALRCRPIGRDRLGHTYWFTQDKDCNLRIYQEHLDEEIWQVVATNRDEFVNLITRLRGNEVVLPSKDIGEADEDTTSSSNTCQEKPPPPEEQEELDHEEDNDDDEGEDEEEEDDDQDDEKQLEDQPKVVPNLKIKLRSPPPEEDQPKVKRVKPLLITQAKIQSPAPSTKKRSLDEVQENSSITLQQEEEQKMKNRPTLLDTKRIKKPSRYESTKHDDHQSGSAESGDDEEGEEEEEEGEDGEEEDSELEEGEEENSEDIDSAAADIEEDEDDDDDAEDDEDDDVGETIEDPPIKIFGQGSGKDCDGINLFLHCTDDDDIEESPVGEAIEEPVHYVQGLGNGASCLVGNDKNESSEDAAAATATPSTEPKATFFFGEPGCLKLSPIKQQQTPKPSATKRSIFDSVSEEKTNGESVKERDVTPPRNGDGEQKVEQHEIDNKKGIGTEATSDAPEQDKVDKEKSETKAISNELKDDETKVEQTNEKISESVKETVEKGKCDRTKIETIPEESKQKVPPINSPKADLHMSNKLCSDDKALESVAKLSNEKTKSEDLTLDTGKNQQSGESIESSNEIGIERLTTINDSIDLSKKVCNVTETSKNSNGNIVKPCETSKSDKLEKTNTEMDEKCIKVSEDIIKSDATPTGQDKKDARKESSKKESVPILADKCNAETVRCDEKSSIKANSMTKHDEYSSDCKKFKSETESENEKDKKTTETIAIDKSGHSTIKSDKDETVKKSSSDSNTLQKLKDFVVQKSKELPSTSKVDLKRKETNDLTKKSSPPKEESQVVPNITAKTTTKTTVEKPKSTMLGKRRLNLPPPRQSTSESEVDALEEEQQEEDLDDSDIGGKRIKMRPKISNTDARRKVEAQKTQIEETSTSSSGGEEDSRSRRKIAAPKRQLEKINASPATTTTTPAISNTKQKPTLAEIIEKKLKKTPEKAATTADAIVETSTKSTTRAVDSSPDATTASAAAVAAFTPPKKSPITKPLKKNLLTQIRQEESDEEATPRKRTNSETVAPPSVPPAALSTEERQRKRRSSEDAKEAKESSSGEESLPAVSEKLKRNNEREQVETVSKSTQSKNKNAKSPPILIKNEEESETIPKTEPKHEEKESSPSPSKDLLDSLASNRRSGRRGGAAVVHSELPQPKRTRGSGGGGPTKSPPDTIKEAKNEAAVKVENKTELKEEEEANKEKNLIKAEKSHKPEEESPAKLEAIVKEVEQVEETPKAPAVKTGPGRGRGPRKKRDVDTTNIIESNDSETPVRQSRRIAQQKIKEEAERRKLEEVALRTMKQELKKKKKAEKEADPTVPEPSAEEESSEEASEAEEASNQMKKKAKKKCPGKDGTWSSDSEEQAESEEEEEEPPHYETDPGSPLFKSDHEFSPESDVEDETQLVPMKRARTVRKENAEDEEFDADEACQKCGKSDHPEWILLCDTPDCNKGYHCSCLSPVLFYIPEGDWHCPPCQQEHLIVALENQLKQFDNMVNQKQEEKRLAEQAELMRLQQEAKDKENAKIKANEHKLLSDDSDDEEEEEIIRQKDKPKRRRGDGRSNRKAAKRGSRRRRGGGGDSDDSSNSHSRGGSGSESATSSSSSNSFSDSDDEPIYKLRKRRQINVSYRLNEYDDLINSALKKEMDEVAGAGNLGRGKDISTIIEADKEKIRQETDDQEEEKKPDLAKEKSDNSSDSDDDDAVPLKSSKIKSKFQASGKKKSRKLTTLDVSSEEDHGSDEDFKTSSYSDEDSSQSASDDSDSSLEVYRRPGRGKKQRKAARRAARERRKDRKFVVDGSDESEEEVQKQKSKTKKKKKEDSDYTETETEDDDDNGSELSENMDSADLCDDTTSESEDGAWHPGKKKKKSSGNKKSNAGSVVARKSPKLKKPAAPAKKGKRLEYSDDDISESEPEDEEEDDEDGAPNSGKGSGKQPRSQPLKTGGSASGPAKAKPKKKPPPSDRSSDEGVSDERTRTRGRRYAYIEDFDDDSSDGGIKPGVQRPDTPPEERQKFIQKQEEIKRMLAEKNAEGAKLAATPRLTPIKGTNQPPLPEQKQRTSSKAGGDSLSTVPLSVIRQAKVLDIDYLQRKGEAIGDLDDVDESELDDAELPDDLPEDMEDAIARMVEEEEQFTAAAANRELPGAEEVLRTTPSKSKPVKATDGPPSSVAAAAPNAAAASSSGLQEPLRKRLPMPTMGPPLLRHQFPASASLLPPPGSSSAARGGGMHPMLQLHLQSQPPQAMQLLQNALSAPLGQPLSRPSYGQHPPPPNPHLPLGMSMPAAAHLMQAAAAAAAVRPPPPASAGAPIDQKPRGRRKKVTPLRDQLQKQQTAAAVTAASSVITGGLPPPPPTDKTKLFKPHEDAAPTSVPASVPTSLPAAPISTQASVITRLPSHLQPPPQHGRGPPGGMYPSSAELARFYGQPLPPTPVSSASATGAGSRSPSTASSPGPPRHLLRPQIPPGLPPAHSALRPTYGPPPPLRGAPPPTSGPPNVGGPSPNARPPYSLHGPEHHGPPPGSIYGAGPPPARHASPHLNHYRAPPIYGNPNYPPRVGPPGAGNMRPGAVDFVSGPRGYPPYGYYPPPPLGTPPAHAAPSSVIVSAPPTHPPTTPTNHSVSALTRGKSPAPAPAAAQALPPVAVPPAPAAALPPVTATAPTPATAPPAAAPEVVVAAHKPSKKLTTLEAYSNTKSPLAPAADSPAAIAAEEDSSSAHGVCSSAPPGAGTSSSGGGVGEFSGLVSYFSSQQDDYDT
ncbi:microtubule-associated protein futsch [Drosophila tropicalis]|uniref:microtubule-associated protein futsch n=1 Tax=Drosophila tropicalis TaxID=46794 RepID=UPI0035ABED8A